jgi:predicted RNase H-like nuclease (RuvC/YqgF family)
MGTFTTGINLVERVADKRKQGKRDKGQDERITSMQKQLEEMETKYNEKDKSEGELKRSMQKSGPMIQQEYDRDYERLGPRFAQGDGKLVVISLSLIYCLGG